MNARIEQGEMSIKTQELSIEGIQNIDLTFGGAVKLHRVNGNPDVEEYDWEEEVKKLLKMPEEEIPDCLSVELEIVGTHRHFILAKDKDKPIWDFVEAVPPTDDNDPGAWGTVHQWSQPTFQAAYFHFLSWYYWVKVRDLQKEKNLPDEVCKNLHNECKAELSNIWATFKEEQI